MKNTILLPIYTAYISFNTIDAVNLNESLIKAVNNTEGILDINMLSIMPR